MIRRQHIVMLALILSGVYMVGSGLYIKAKAEVADWLITSTWEARQPNGALQKPWPWADTWVVAQMTIPRLGIKQFIMQDASGESLAFGAGAVLPVSSDSYNFIAGHRDTHFDYLDQLQAGDTVEIETAAGHKVIYHIRQTQVIDTRDGALNVDTESEGLSLMTCWPMESLVPGGPLRYIVSGDVVYEI